MADDSARAEARRVLTTRPESRELSDIEDNRSITLTGFGVVAAFLLLFFIWGGTMSLSSAAIAPGTVGVEGDKKTIQHLDGGVILEIHSRDGDLVRAGEPLVTLDGDDLQSRHNELELQHIRLGVKRARSLADQTNAPTITLPAWLQARVNEPAVAESLIAQSAILGARRDVLADSLAALGHRIEELDEEKRAALSHARNLEIKRALVDAELAEYRRMEDQGLVTRAQVFELRRELADLMLDIDTARSDATLATARRTQVESSIAELKATRRKDVIEESSLLHAEVDALVQQLDVTGNAIERLVITSPIDGLVVGSQITTRGGVLAPGQRIMEIIPANGRLLIDSRVDPKDRDAIAVGQSAEVRFSAFDRRSSRPVSGRVTLISADRLIDPTSQTPYYQTRIELTEDPKSVLQGAAIYPGMQADVLIATGEQTLLGYLLSPVLRSFDRALRED